MGLLSQYTLWHVYSCPASLPCEEEEEAQPLGWSPGEYTPLRTRQGTGSQDTALLPPGPMLGTVAETSVSPVQETRILFQINAGLQEATEPTPVPSAHSLTRGV